MLILPTYYWYYWYRQYINLSKLVDLRRSKSGLRYICQCLLYVHFFVLIFYFLLYNFLILQVAAGPMTEDGRDWGERCVDMYKIIGKVPYPFMFSSYINISAHSTGRYRY